jgi:glucoselysine-6-phosphate deglycase
MQKLLQVHVEIQTAHTFYTYENVFEKDMLVVGISQSGESTAAVNSIKKANERGLTSLAVTSEDGSYITEHGKYKMIVPSGEEKSGATTKSYTATVLVFMLAALETALHLKRIDEDKYGFYKNGIVKTINGLAAAVAKADEWYEQNRQKLLSARNLIVSGYGNNYGTALEAGLKFLETSRIPVSIYELEEFMHGPYNLIDENSFIFFIVPQDASKERAVKLNGYFSAKTENSFMVIKDNGSGDDKNVCVDFYEDNDFTPLEYIVPLQVLFFRLAKDKGIEMRTVRYPDFHGYMNSKRHFE